MADLETRTFSIGVLTRRFNVSAESLRNWERAGLIPPAHRTPGGHRRYGQAHIDAVHKLLYAPAVELGVVDRPEVAIEQGVEGVEPLNDVMLVA